MKLLVETHLWSFWTEHEFADAGEGAAQVDSEPVGSQIIELNKKCFLIPAGDYCFVLRGIYPSFEEAKAEMDRMHMLNWRAWLKEWKEG